MPTLPSPIVVASILAGVPTALWAYKCAMMVLFQRKIIYMGYAPLGARKDRLVDVSRSHLEGISCSEQRIVSSTGSSISALIVRPSSTSKTVDGPNPNVVVLYLQGNAGNPLHRIPVFQSLLSAHSSVRATVKPDITVMAPAPRSYWTSRGRPSQRGILTDYTSVLSYTLDQYPRARIVLYGHSLGGAVALCLLSQRNLSEVLGKDAERVSGVILENPFASIPGMVEALYPQKWLPYRYLKPFVWDRWDALGALKESSDEGTEKTLLERLRRRILVLTSEHDEIVPNEMGAEIVQAALHRNGSFPVSSANSKREDDVIVKDGKEGTEPLKTKLVTIRGALHEDAWRRKGWAEAVGAYVGAVSNETQT